MHGEAASAGVAFFATTAAMPVLEEAIHHELSRLVSSDEMQLLDLVAAWGAADPSQRSRLVAGIFDQLEAEVLPEGRIRVVAVPRPAWRPFFECW